MEWQIGTQVRNQQTGHTGKVVAARLLEYDPSIYYDILESCGILSRSTQASHEYYGWRAIG